MSIIGFSMHIYENKHLVSIIRTMSFTLHFDLTHFLEFLINNSLEGPIPSHRILHV